MSTTKRIKRTVTIDYRDPVYGIVELYADILYHSHELDGSQIVLLKTDPTQRENSINCGKD